MGAIRRNRLRALGLIAATQAASPAGLRPGPAATEYLLQRARLGVDLRRLSEIQSIEKRIELKRELVPEYQDWVAGVLAADSGAQDDIVVAIMIWTFDIDALDAAMPLARYVVRHNLTLPERYRSTAPTLIVDIVTDAALKRLGQDPDDADRSVMRAMLRTLDEVDELVADADIFDAVRAKLEKAIGMATARLADATAADADGPAGLQRGLRERALGRLRRAAELDTSSGVKTKIKSIEAAIRKSGDGDDAPAEPDPVADLADRTLELLGSLAEPEA